MKKWLKFKNSIGFEENGEVYYLQGSFKKTNLTGKKISKKRFWDEFLLIAKIETLYIWQIHTVDNFKNITKHLKDDFEIFNKSSNIPLNLAIFESSEINAFCLENIGWNVFEAIEYKKDLYFAYHHLGVLNNTKTIAGITLVPGLREVMCNYFIPRFKDFGITTLEDLPKTSNIWWADLANECFLNYQKEIAGVNLSLQF